MKVLCVAAHPDDEVLGAGGTLAKHVAEGDEVEVFLLSDGAMARFETETEAAAERRAERRAEAAAAGDILGVSDVTVLDYWGNQLDDVPLIDVVRDVESKIDAFRPDVIYTHHYGDLNVDHELVARAVRTAARPTVGSPVDRVLSFETLSATEWGMPSPDNAFQPTTFVDIDEYLERKMAAIDAYESEMRERPHPRSTEAIRNNATVWGDKSGLFAAEPFELLVERRR
ncbi:PIG-L deacetylase family protein [Natrinema salaciae]|uniref:N-acetylglucosaminyl deacetylase, LmbE family n=1 Tax=Natrinema salaciae TaxID=1186196 RepID=A0A1H9GNU6_9EURY|nr:PIG-L deacetylase family protein [Natrinema salaciae]SEQ51693.1 N-acetylglucosaminyl deacetylase, LmbE family [Natrinema salaciae]